VRMMGAPYLPGFGRCGIPRLSVVRSLPFKGSRGPLLSTPCTVKGRGLWYPTSAKTGQIWGTHHSLQVEISPLATIGCREVCEKSRLGDKVPQTQADDVGHHPFHRSYQGHLETAAPPGTHGDQ
jgi:hypothetical protein